MLCRRNEVVHGTAIWSSPVVHTDLVTFSRCLLLCYSEPYYRWDTPLPLYHICSVVNAFRIAPLGLLLLLLNLDWINTTYLAVTEYSFALDGVQI